MSKCKPIDHPNILPSWGCCECRTLNSDFRPECRYCGHERCDVLDEDTEPEGVSKDLN